MGNSCGCDGGAAERADEGDVMNYADALHAFQCKLSPDTKRRLYLDCVRNAIVSRRRERSFGVVPSFSEVEPTDGVAPMPEKNRKKNKTQEPQQRAPAGEAPSVSFDSSSQVGGIIVNPVTVEDILDCVQQHNLAPASSTRTSASSSTSKNAPPPITTIAAASRLFKAGDLDRKRVPVELEEVTFERIVAALVRVCDELLIPHVLAPPPSHHIATAAVACGGEASAAPMPTIRLLRASWLATIENAVEFPVKLSGGKGANEKPSQSGAATAVNKNGGNNRNNNKKSSSSSDESTDNDDGGQDGSAEQMDFTGVVDTSEKQRGDGADSAHVIGENVPTVRQYPSTTVEVAFYEPSQATATPQRRTSPTSPTGYPSSSLFEHLNSYFCSRPSLPTDHPLFRGLYRLPPKQHPQTLAAAHPLNANDLTSEHHNAVPTSAQPTVTGDASLDALFDIALSLGPIPTGVHLEDVQRALHRGGSSSPPHRPIEEQDTSYGTHLRANVERCGSRAEAQPSKMCLLDGGEGVLGSLPHASGGPSSTPPPCDGDDLNSWVDSYLASVDLRHLVAWPPSSCVKAPTVLTIPGSPFQVLKSHIKGGTAGRKFAESNNFSDSESFVGNVVGGGGGGGGNPLHSSSINAGESEDVTVLVLFYHRRDRTQTALRTNARETKDARKWSSLTQEDEPRRLFRPMGYTSDVGRPQDVTRLPGNERLPATAPANRGAMSAGAAVLAADVSTQKVPFRAVRRALQGSHFAEREDRRIGELASAIPDAIEVLRERVPPPLRALLFDDQTGAIGVGGAASSPSESSLSSLPLVASSRALRFAQRLKTTLLKPLFTAEPYARLGWLLNSPYLLSTSQASSLKRITLQQAQSAELRGEAAEVVVEALCIHLRVEAPQTIPSGGGGDNGGGTLSNLSKIGTILGAHGATTVSELLHKHLLREPIPCEASLTAAVESALRCLGTPQEQEAALERMLFVHDRTEAAFRRMEARLQGGQGGGVDAASFKQIQMRAPENTAVVNNAKSGASTAPQPPLGGCAMTSTTSSSLRTALAHPLSLVGYLLQEEVWMRDLFELGPA